MINAELRSQIDRIWEAFWTGGISNPLTVIEQFTFLLFLRHIDERQLLEEKEANMIGGKVQNPLYDDSTQLFRWNILKNNDPECPRKVDILTMHTFVHIMHGLHYRLQNDVVCDYKILQYIQRDLILLPEVT